MWWALIAHPDQFRNGQLLQVPKQIAEDCLGTAVSQGWVVLARDSDVLLAADDPVQSNPRRPKHGYGYSEEDGA